MMKSCEETQLLLTEYAANELDRTEAGLVRSHLASCAECRDELKRELRLRELLEGLPVRECPVGAVGEPQPGRAPAVPRRLAFAVGLAAMLLVAVLAWQGVPSFERSGDAGPARVAVDTVRSPAYSADELDTAQQQLAYSLSLTARIIRRGQRETVHDVFGERLPRVLSDSLRKTIHTNQGDQG